MKYPFAFILSLLFMVSCQRKDPNQQIDEGNVDKNIYTSSEIGWSIKIPDGWEVLEKDKLEASEEKGKAALEKTAGGTFDSSDLKHLISFKKDKFNIFLSTSQPFKEEHPGEYEERNGNLKKLLYNTFADQGIKVDTLSGNIKVGGLHFSSFTIKVYARDGKLILTQIMSSKLINGYDFGTVVNYNNDKDRNIMLEALKASTFSGKN